MGTNMAGENQQKHVSLSFGYKSVNYIPRGNQKQYKTTVFSSTRNVQIAKFPEISRFFHKNLSAVMYTPGPHFRRFLESGLRSDVFPKKIWGRSACSFDQRRLAI